MITSHHSFSTRIFLKETPAVHSQVLPAVADTSDNLREFWWFLRNAHPQSREVISAQRQTRKAAVPAIDSGSGATHA
jgi:uncharacterized membrane protein